MRKAFLLLGAAAVLVTSGCRTVSTAQPTVLRDTAARLSALDQRITGTPHDRAAGSLVQYVDHQLPIRRCMAAAGFDYTPPPWDNPFASWPADRPIDYIDVLIPIDDTHVQRGFYLAEDHSTPAESANPGYLHLHPADRQRYTAQLTTCARPPSIASDFPPGALELAGQLGQALAQALDTPQFRDVAAAYPRCMAKAGYPVSSRTELAELIRARHFTNITDAELPHSHAAEIAAARADAICRRDSYPLALTLVAPAIDAFQTTYADALTAVDAGWRNLHAKANTARNQIDWQLNTSPPAPTSHNRDACTSAGYHAAHMDTTRCRDPMVPR